MAVFSNRDYWSASEDDTARLILMGLEDGTIPRTQPGSSMLRDFALAYREHHPGAPLMQCKHMYEKYKGFDGRVMPSHDLHTGEPIR